MAAAQHFDSWSDAFDVCRERDAPMLVVVNGEKAKLFPSGRMESRLPRRFAGQNTLTETAPKSAPEECGDE